jgi:hypothetical protein
LSVAAVAYGVADDSFIVGVADIAAGSGRAAK